MNFVIPNIIPALPEMFVLSMACVILVADLFLSERLRSVSFYLAQITLVGAALLTAFGMSHAPVTTFERNFLIRALEKSGWNVTATARTLGIPLSTLKFKMDRLEIRELARKIRGN